ncbi:MAG: sigma-54 dependent transcriptional regulator [Polyangiaceae bacterium]|nr:sigma-54 dependent transcriptional regulator [Polyangiaceae bacterium]
MERILVINDDQDSRERLLQLVLGEGFEGIGAADAKTGISAALAQHPDVIVCDVSAQIMDGHYVLRAVRDYPETAGIPFILLSGGAQPADLRTSMRCGADDYLTKPFELRELLASVRAQRERHSLLSDLLRSTPAAAEDDTSLIIGAPAMEAVYQRGLRAAQSNLSVLLVGEAGVGKDVLAHALHKASARAKQPFMPLNCASLPESLLEGELFGEHKAGSNGTVSLRPGLFEAAHGGTVFLDEVGDLPMSAQAQLLRVLEERQVVRPGGTTPYAADNRLIAATNRDLEAHCADGNFRSDLFYRIAGVTLSIPPLRDRIEEIVPFAERFARNMCLHLGITRVPTLSHEARQLLLAYTWPGNVRELRSAIEQAVALRAGENIQPEHLPTRIRARSARASERPQSSPVPRLKDNLRNLERQRILDALDHCGGNQSRAAVMLGISRGTLISRLSEYEIVRPRKRVGER